ncbi:MAG: hypothetical protein PHQ34_06010 [Methanothrix sp.]|nr:hypothetical protein [Methanothrix sp.]
MYGDYYTSAIGMLHEEVAAFLSHRLKAYPSQSLDHYLGLNRVSTGATCTPTKASNGATAFRF